MWITAMIGCGLMATPTALAGMSPIAAPTFTSLFRSHVPPLDLARLLVDDENQAAVVGADLLVV